MNIEVVSKHHGVNLGFGINTEYDRDYGGILKGGYSYIWPLPIFKINNREWLSVKTSLDAIYLAGVVAVYYPPVEIHIWRHLRCRTTQDTL